MSRRTAGVMFCLIAAILCAARYIAAAIFMSGVSSWDRKLFAVGLEYVGTPLQTLSIISLIIGIAYLVLAEFPDRFKNN